MDKCKVCTNEFKRKYPRGGIRKIYCSKKCRYSDSFVIRICKTCNKKFKTNIVSTKKEYCSLACIQRHPCQLCGAIITGRKTFQSGEKKFCTRKCSNFFNRTITSRKAYVARGYALSIKKYGKPQCDECGYNELSGLVVHHINHNRDDNSYMNLVTLCANCHHAKHWGEESVKRVKLLNLAFLLVQYDCL